MMELLRELGPLHRTLACDDTDRALQIVCKYMPGAKMEGFATGSNAWSWVIPPRWELKGAVVRAGGKTLVDARENHLHVVNYSVPFKGVVKRADLLRHLHTCPERPDAIPFVYSFYERTWGFCIPHNWLERFTSDTFEVEIDSYFEEGDLNILSAYLPGREKETFIICADICHPTQVNDSLTGVAAAVDIANRLNRRKERKYSFLFLIVPETIGSIAFLSHHPKIIDVAVGGLFSEMLGTPGHLVGKTTRKGNTYWDGALTQALRTSGISHKTVPFLKGPANDDKVLDSPGVDIPTVSLVRYPYPEYHTSDDNIDLIDVAQLREARDVLQYFVDLAESDYIPHLNQPGPVFLSGHGLYPNFREDSSLLPFWEAFLDVMYSLDGQHSLLQIAMDTQRSVEQVRYWCEAFSTKGLLTKEPFVVRRNRLLS
jgi:aminopeptidase-like protein